MSNRVGLSHTLTERSQLLWEYAIYRYEKRDGGIKQNKKDFIDSILRPQLKVIHSENKELQYFRGQIGSMNKKAHNKFGWSYTPSVFGLFKGSQLHQEIKNINTRLQNKKSEDDLFDRILVANKAMQGNDKIAAVALYKEAIAKATNVEDQNFIIECAFNEIKHYVEKNNLSPFDNFSTEIINLTHDTKCPEKSLALLQENICVYCKEYLIKTISTSNEKFEKFLSPLLYKDANLLSPFQYDNESNYNFITTLEDAKVLTQGQVDTVKASFAGCCKAYINNKIDSEDFYISTKSTVEKAASFLEKFSKPTYLELSDRLNKYRESYKEAHEYIYNVKSFIIDESANKFGIDDALSRITLRIGYEPPQIGKGKRSENEESIANEKINKPSVLRIFKKWAGEFLQNLITHKTVSVNTDRVARLQKECPTQSLYYEKSSDEFSKHHHDREAVTYLNQIKSFLKKGNNGEAKKMIKEVLCPLVTMGSTAEAFKQLIGLNATDPFDSQQVEDALSAIKQGLETEGESQSRHLHL